MTATAAYPGLRAVPVPQVPVARMVIGQSVEDAAALLPRLFNLCRVAQGLAVRAAFDLPLPDDWQEALRQEIMREHLLKLCLKWPAALNVARASMPRNWAERSPAARHEVFGTDASLYRGDIDIWRYKAGDGGVAAVLRAIGQVFAPGAACRPALPLATPDTCLADTPQENSVAARHADHPALRAVEARYGRGPLWSAVGVALDLEYLWAGGDLACHLSPGQAVVPAARGLYAVRGTSRFGKVTAFRRVTPTDHLLAPGGALQHALATLPSGRADLSRPDPRGALLLSILDPCQPVRLEPIHRQEPAHA